MTVRDLIERLSKLEPDRHAMVWWHDGTVLSVVDVVPAGADEVHIESGWDE